MPRMESLEPIQQTLREIDKGIPDALRAVLGLRKRSSRSSGDVAGFAVASSQSQQPPQRDAGDESPMDVDAAVRMDWASCYVSLHGEDAHFGHDGTGVVGVADGAFSLGLVTSAFDQLLAIEPAGRPVCPKALLEWAYEETIASAASGGSTAVILSLAGTALKWAYIGDSAFAVFRDGAVLHRSRPQQKSFNHPFQLSAVGTGDSVGEMTVENGDVLVVGTDGLFDNMFDSELELVVRMGTDKRFSAKNMADVLAGVAYEISLSGARDTPYSRQSRELRGDRRRGGKQDDITVVVAFITSEFPTTNRSSA